MSHATAPGLGKPGLADAIERYSTLGLLRRYARGRVKTLGQRLFLTVVGAGALWLVDSPQVAILAFVLSVLGEALDCLYLRGVSERLGSGASLTRTLWISTVTAALQALTVAACVGLSWFGPAGTISPLFTVGFLTAAAINAGMVLPYHRPAAIARLSVYGVAALVFYGFGAFQLPNSRESLPLNVAGLLVLIYMVPNFIAFVVKGFEHQRENILALTEQGRMVAQANAELQARERENHRLATAVRHANDSVVICEPDGRIVWVNDAFTRITGYSEAEAVGVKVGGLLNAKETDPGTIDAIRDALDRGVPFRGEVLNRTKSGKLKWIETNQFPINERGIGNKADLVVAIERDITEAKQQEQVLANAKRAAEDGARAKAEFLATMSHEIRTPMNAVIGMADLLCDSDLSREQRVYTDTIRASSQALLHIINDVLELSKLDAGKTMLVSDPFDLRQCLEGIIRLLHPQAEDKGLDLRIEMTEVVPHWVSGDEGRIRQVLINLVGNAIKFTQVGNVLVRVDAVETDVGTRITTEVVDTGIGIDEDKLDLIFESFAQADAATTRRFGGTGLGLTISRRLVHAMGGMITARSTVGQGSRFTVTLTLAPATRPRQAAKSGLPPGMDSAGLAGMRVLVAEDNRVNRLLVSKYLSDLGVELAFAHDGEQAVEMSKTGSWDLILMDMSMPIMNGLDATRIIRAMPRTQPPIVALTANAFDSDREACRDAGMDGFLTKPVRRSALVDCLAQHRPGVALTAQA